MDLLPDIINGKRRGFKRLAVDQGNTGFFEGLEFRTFKEWGSSTTANYVIKVVTPVDVILWELGLILDDGAARIESVVGGTEGGTFNEVLSSFPANAMAEKPVGLSQASVVTMSAGGTHSGGTVLDVFRLKTVNNSNQAQTVGGSLGHERGVAAGTYYFRIQLTAAIGVFRARWEERR